MAKDPNFGAQGKLGNMAGTYGRKAENLTKKELKKAGGAKAAAARKVDITKTTRDYSRGITLGPKGKPLTGSVTLSNGNTAVYKAGKRVMKAAASKPVSKRAATGPSAGTNPTPRTNPQSDMGATKPAASKNIGYTAGKGKTAATKNIGYTAGKTTMRSTAGKKQVVAGTPNTAAKKYKTPGPDLGAAFEAWKAKPAISAKDRQRAKDKTAFEKKGREALIRKLKGSGNR